MRQHKHLSRENFDQHISEVNLYMNKVDGSLSDTRGWDAMISELAESLREDHRGSLDIPAAYQRAMTRVWDLIVYDTNNSPQDVVKTYYITEPIDRKNESGARIYVETFSFLSADKWSLNTRVGLLINNHSISSVLINKEKEKIIDIRQQGQFDALMEKPKRPYPVDKMSKEERMARGKTDPVLDRLEALEHDLTEVMTALVSKDIMRSH